MPREVVGDRVTEDRVIGLAVMTVQVIRGIVMNLRRHAASPRK
jgi:hypothetical protein